MAAWTQKIFLKLFKSEKNQKLGTVRGVFVPNILQMIGVILFMRLGWITGHVGIFKMTIIISMSSTLLFITSLSMTSIVSNMKIGSGGAYYLISRVLGIEFGSAIGILLCAAQHCSIALCVSGFAYSLHEFLPMVPMEVLKIGTILGLIIITYISTDLAVKTQTVIFITLAISIFTLFFGSGKNVPESIQPLPVAPSLSFWMAFAMFFPATTGIEAGMSLSGDLKNPSRSLPIGTMFSVVVAYILYLNIALFLSKEASGQMLRSYPMLPYYMSKVGFIIILGIWGATLSSALGSILGAPRVMQAIAKDGILPKFLAKGYGPLNQPRIATIVVLCLALLLTINTDINQIIPVLTMACLVSYCLINFVAFFEQFIRNPSWRPSFKVPWIISLIGCIGCFMAMFMINPGATFIVVGLAVVICIWTSSRKIHGNWDDIRYSLFSFLVHRGTAKLSAIQKNPKSWRPHILAIFDPPHIHKNMAYFAHCLNQEKGFLTFGICHAEDPQRPQELHEWSASLKQQLNAYKIPSYLHVNPGEESIAGIIQLINNYGLGPMKPNTIILPMQEAYLASEKFFKLLLDANYYRKNIILLNEENNNLHQEKKSKQINLWWGGEYLGNFELCLALAHILQNSRLWSGSKISIKTIIKDEATRSKMYLLFQKYQQRLRIRKLNFTPLVDASNEFIPNLLHFSSDADLTFLGLRRYKDGESFEDYKNYLRSVFEKTKSVKNIAFVLSGEQLNFEKIFF